MPGIGSRLLILGLALALAPTTAQALTYNFDFTTLSGPANLSGTVTFADPEPFDGAADINAFSVTDGSLIWTESDDLSSFPDPQGLFVSGEPDVVAIKVTDTDSNVFLEIVSDGSWSVAESAGTYEVVPEPGTALLLAVGLTGLAARRRPRPL